MTELEKVEIASTRERLERKELEAGPDAKAALIEGWDFTYNPNAMDPPGFGVWRAPHLKISNFYDDSANATDGGQQILHAGMSRSEMYAGFWRLARLYPEHRSVRDHRSERTGYAEAALDETKVAPQVNCFLWKKMSIEPDRDKIIRSILGQSLLDGVDFLCDLQCTNIPLADLLITKRFGQAFEKFPGVENLPWPASCQTRWKLNGGASHLPPFYFLVHLAEFQRLAQNSAALMDLTFDEHGDELSIAKLKNVLKSVENLKPENVGDRLPSNVKKLGEMAIYQTHALLPSRENFESGDQAAAQNHSNEVSRLVRENLGIGGSDFVDFLAYKENSPAIGQMIKLLGYHHDRNPGISNNSKTDRSRGRAEGAPTYWSHDWLAHPVIGLFEIASSVKEYNTKLGEQKLGKKIAVNADKGLVISGDNAPVRIAMFWLEGANEAAFRKQLTKVALQNDETQTFEAGIYLLEDPIPAIRAKFVRKCKRRAQRKTAVDSLGITARYNPRYWTAYGKENDIQQYQQHETVSASEFAALGIDVSDRLSANGKLIESTMSRSRLKTQIQGERQPSRKPVFSQSSRASVAAVASQNLAMSIGALSTDPQHGWNVRHDEAV
ncbi:hypothetical protein [Novosphingopyxis sp.]|uniref:hypothetical protein n=1 Tax=Novosphingopyxis sp. TaxID=2709690 RepID=UPI003B5C8EA4